MTPAYTFTCNIHAFSASYESEKNIEGLWKGQSNRTVEPDGGVLPAESTFQNRLCPFLERSLWEANTPWAGSEGQAGGPGPR